MRPCGCIDMIFDAADIDRFTTEATRDPAIGRLHRHPAALVPHAYFHAVQAVDRRPFVEISLRASRKIFFPAASKSARACSKVSAVPWTCRLLRWRIKPHSQPIGRHPTGTPARIAIVSHMHVAIVDVPTFLRGFCRSAAGESGQAPLKRRRGRLRNRPMTCRVGG